MLSSALSGCEGPEIDVEVSEARFVDPEPPSEVRQIAVSLLGVSVHNTL